MYEELTKLAIALLIGSLLGLEREYHNKPAGFRTIALICVGARVSCELDGIKKEHQARQIKYSRTRFN